MKAPSKKAAFKVNKKPKTVPASSIKRTPKTTSPAPLKVSKSTPAPKKKASVAPKPARAATPTRVEKHQSKSIASGGGAQASAGSNSDNLLKLDLQFFAGGSAKGKSNLDWSITKKATGETRVDHVMKHGKNDLQKKQHGVFYGNPVDKINEAFANKGNIVPIRQKSVDIYHIPYANAGYAGGYAGQGQNLNNITVVLKGGTNQIITGYPSANRIR